jgi:Peptidase_C39 like family
MPEIADYTNLAASSATSTVLTYAGVREVLLNSPITLRGTYDPWQIAKVSLVAEDKFPLTVNLDKAAKTWQVNLERGFQAPGARWLRLKGLDSAGKEIVSQVIYITVNNNPLSVGQLTLKVVNGTFFKAKPLDSSRLSAQQKVMVDAEETFQVVRYGFVDGHLKVELKEPIAPLGKFGYFYEDFVQLSKGSQILRFEIEDVPTTPVSAIALITANTLIKTKPTDSSVLPANQKVELTQGQTLEIIGYACTRGHFRLRLKDSLPGLGAVGFVYWQHVQVKRGNTVILFDPNALSITANQPTLFKKRPIESAKLAANERFNFAKGGFYGVGSYLLEAGHVKVSLTEELPNFGNTGYLFPGHVQMRRGSRIFNPFPPQVELNVPYFSQRDNPRSPGSTCNVTSIAMVMYYHGVRSKGGGQLEDELLQWCLNKGGPGCQTDNAMLSKLIAAYGFKTSFSTTRKWAEIKTELVNRRPVVLGGDFTATGHIVCVIGYTPQGYIVNDPWGDALTGYTDTEGRKLLYPYSYMDRVAGPDGNVWAHIISR